MSKGAEQQLSSSGPRSADYAGPGHSQVAATVTASPPRFSDISAGQPRCGSGSGNADFFPCLYSGKKILPLWSLRNGLLPLAAAGPLGNPGREIHAGTAPVTVYAAMTVLVAVLVVVRHVRQLLVRRQLARRVTYALLPSTSFDPAPEDVVRFAHQLARARPAVAWLRPRRGASIRIRLYTDDEGHLSYQISGAASAGSVLRHQSYAYVELREAVPEGGLSPEGQMTPASAEPSPLGTMNGNLGQNNRWSFPHGTDDARDGLAGDNPPRQVHVARAELVLAADVVKPLRPMPLRPDLLQSFAAAVLDVRPALGERAEICIDLVPVTAARAARLRRARIRAAVTNSGHGLVGAGRALLAELAGEFIPARGPRTSQNRTGGRPASRAEVQAAAGKLADPLVPLFEVQVLAAARSQIEGRAEAHLHQILAAFDVMRGENWWRAAGHNLGIAHIGADSVWRRRRFDQRMDTGEFAPQGRSLVTAAEIAGLLKPPTRHCAHHNVRRSGGLVPPPPRTLPEWSGQPGVLPIGYAPGPDGRERLLGAPLDDLFFSLRVGKSRYGKTETALVQAIALALTGRTGVWFLDPHADGWRRARPLLTDPQVLTRLWEVDLTVRGDDAKIAGYNPLDMTGQSAGQIEDRVDAVVTAIASALSWGDSAPRARTILTKSCETLCHLALRLPPGTAPTLFQIRTLLDDPDWREAVLPSVPASLRSYWERTFPRYPADATPVVTNVIERIAASRTLSAFFGTSRSTYDVRAAMDNGAVVFVCPPGGDIGRLAACFLIYDLFRAGKSRTDLPAGQRPRFDAFIDEVTAVDGAAKGHLAAILEQLAKYGLRLHAMTQMAQRLTPATRDALLQNQSLLSSTAGDIDAVKLIAKQWTGQVEPATIAALPRFHHVVSVTVAGQTTTPFKVRGALVTELFGDQMCHERLGIQRAAIDANLHRRRVGDILADLDTLDERILDTLGPGASRDVTGRVPASARRPRRGDGHTTSLDAGTEGEQA